jgi:phage FluMu protein Com
MKFLCKLGIHKIYNAIRFSGIEEAYITRKCIRCGEIMIPEYKATELKWRCEFDTRSRHG